MTVRRPARALLVAPLTALALLAGCSTDPGSSAGSRAGADASEATPSTSAESPGSADASPVDPEAPTSWGPTEGELVQAREQVSGWDDARLAGQLIVGRYYGTDPSIPADLVERLHLAGVSVTGENAVDEAQVRATTKAVARAHAADGRRFPPVIGVDEEGGAVSHLRGIATEFPPFAAAGRIVGSDGTQGEAVVRSAAGATALELRDLGFTWVFAPVADVTIGPADVTIGTRSPSEEPQLAARAVAAAVEGYDEAGLVSTVKHFPGHGSVTTDSHLALPVLDTPLARLEKRDLLPFRAAVDAAAPVVMMSHIDVEALEPGKPASIAGKVYRYLRRDLGFEGVAITDSLGMGAVSARKKPALQAIKQGADLLLMPIDAETAHATLVDGLGSGDLPRPRAVDAATKVVALQLWQQRVAGEVPVPDDVAERARRASARLSGSVPPG